MTDDLHALPLYGLAAIRRNDDRSLRQSVLLVFQKHQPWPPHDDSQNTRASNDGAAREEHDVASVSADQSDHPFPSLNRAH